MALYCLRCGDKSRKASNCTSCGTPGWNIRHASVVSHHPYLERLPHVIARNNPMIPFPIESEESDFTNYAARIENTLRRFVHLTDAVKLSPRKDGMSIITPRGKYRIIVAKTPRWTHDPIRGYYTYVITAKYLDPTNVEAMHAVFRILFMGDEYLLPFLQPGPKVLTRPQIKCFEAFKLSYDSEEDAGGAIILPTGIGKTVLAAKIIRYALGSGGRLLFLAHRNLILDQAIKTILEENPQFSKKNVGKLFGYTRDKESHLKRKAVFGTPNSIFARLDQISSDAFDFVIIDEFHHGPSMRYRAILDHLTPRYSLGLTATPYRRDDNDPLAMVAHNVLYIEEDWEKEQRLRDGEGFLPSFRLSSALALGYLVTPTIYIEKESAYHDSEGEIIPVNKLHEYAIPARAKKIAEKFHEHIGDRQTVIFCGSVNEAGFLTEQFNAMGIPSSFLLSRYPNTTKAMPLSARKKIIKAYRQKKIKVLFTVDIFNEGADVPTIEAAIWLQQSSTMVKILQQLGRGLRLAPGKRELIVLDFVNNIKQVKAFLKYGRTSTGKLEPIEAAPPAGKVENKDLIDLLIDEDYIKIHEEILYLLERENWEDSDEYSSFYEILCDYGYTDREIVDIINETQKVVQQREPDITYRPIGTKRVTNWIGSKKFFTRPSSPLFRAYFFRDILKEMALNEGIIGATTQNAEDNKRKERCIQIFSRYHPFGDEYPDKLIERHRHVVAQWNGMGRYRYALGKYIENVIKNSEPPLEENLDTIRQIVEDTIRDPSGLKRYITVPSISRLFDSNPLDRIVGAAHQYLKQLPQFAARNLYAKDRLDFIQISDRLGIPYDKIKDWYGAVWDYDRDRYLSLHVKRLLKKRYGLKRGEPGPDPTGSTFSSMISYLAQEFDEDAKDIKDIVIELLEEHQMAEARRQAQREAHTNKRSIAPEPINRPTGGYTKRCKSCENEFKGRTKKCKSCQTPLCPSCAKDFCGVCYTTQG